MNGYWKIKKEKLKLKYISISDEDLNYKEGYENLMLEKLGVKLGKSEEEMLNIIIEF